MTKLTELINQLNDRLPLHAEARLFKDNPDPQDKEAWVIVIFDQVGRMIDKFQVKCTYGDIWWWR